MPFITPDMLDKEPAQASTPSFGGRFITEAELDSPRPMWKDIGTSISQGASFGLADEGAAGLRALFKDTTYDQELEAIRGGQKNFAKEHPWIDTAANVVGGLGQGAGLAVRGAKTGIAGLSMLGKASAAAKEGAALGSLYGFGQGEGGLTERAKSAGVGAALGGVASGGLSLAGQGLLKGAGKLSNLADDVKPSTAEEKTIQSLGITRADYSKANKFAKAAIAEENPLVKSIDLAKSKGVFVGNPDPETILSRNLGEVEKLGNQVTSILKKADTAQKDVPELALTTVQQHLADNPFQKKELATQLERRLEVINTEWDGTISGLNKVKQKIGRIAYKGTTDSQALDKALYTDLKNTIEKSAEKYGGAGLGEQVKSLNQEIGSHLNLKPIIEKALNKDLQATTAAPKTDFLGRAYDTAALAELAITGSPNLLLLKGASKAVTSDIGRKGISKGIEYTGTGTGALSNLLQNSIGRGGAISGISRFEIPKEKVSQQKEILNSGLPHYEKQSNKQENKKVSSKSSSYLPQARNISLNSTTSRAGNQSKTEKVFELLLDSVKKIESNGNPKAVSHAGAKGAYQFMDKTAKAYGLKDPFHEPSARKAAAALIQDEYEALGSMPLALAAYNAGRPAVERAIKKAGSRNWQLVSRYLPSETRKYVPKIEAVFERLVKNA